MYTYKLFRRFARFEEMKTNFGLISDFVIDK